MKLPFRIEILNLLLKDIEDLRNSVELIKNSFTVKAEIEKSGATHSH